MYELKEAPVKLQLLQQQLIRVCNKPMIEEDLLTIKSLVDNFLFNDRQRYADEFMEEFGSTKDDFDEWMHDPGK